MVNEHLSADEIVWCEQLVQEIAAIVREEKQNDQLSMQNEDGHVITLKYGGITVHVYSEKINIQASGSGVKSYEDGLLWTLLQENSVKDRLLVLQRQFREGCGVMPAWRRGAWHGSVWPVRYCPAYPQATAATRLARTVPGAAFPAPPGRPAAS